MVDARRQGITTVAVKLGTRRRPEGVRQKAKVKEEMTGVIKSSDTDCGCTGP